MDWEELQEWRVLERIEPFGDTRADLHNAQLCQLLANIHRDSKKKPLPFTLRDFLFDFEPRKPQTPDDILRIMSSMMQIQNRKPS